ncbi:MAG: trans-2,3-dihydro-3-hydroxyanthranilate isomerase, partial [Acetobacteraceae bacterium]|nr:trans-2,3-dihydro-3-hydroxyanthranilate isomerase [Acetobacteraceae bacterium]
MTRHFYTLDVFTGQMLAGNPLAVVLDASGLDDQRMQASPASSTSRKPCSSPLPQTPPTARACASSPPA